MDIYKSEKKFMNVEAHAYTSSTNTVIFSKVREHIVCRCLRS